MSPNSLIFINIRLTNNLTDIAKWILLSFLLSTEHLSWYVYRLIDPRDGSTFYVGKAKVTAYLPICGWSGSGWWWRVTEQQAKANQRNKLAGLEVIHVIHRHGMTDEKDGVHSWSSIDAYLGLTNISTGAGSNEFGAAHAKELIATYQPENHNISS